MKNWKDWQKGAVGKNVHSVYSRCPHCLGMGINMPLDDICGNCGKDGCITFYDEETVDNILIENISLRQEAVGRMKELTLKLKALPKEKEE